MKVDSRVPMLRRSLLADFDREFGEAVDAGVAQMRSAVPVASGTLRDGIRAEKTPDGGYRVTAPFYWRFVNYGTRHVAARPFKEAGVEKTLATLRRARLG